MEATVSEIHRHPLMPEGYAEPLFHSHKSRKEILEHLARSRWLGKASELPVRERGARAYDSYSAVSAVSPDSQGSRGAKDPVARVLASWREVDRWWEPDGGVDRVLYLVRTATGAEKVRHGSPPAA